MQQIFYRIYGTEQNKTAISSYVWEDTLDSGLSYVAGSLQVNVGGEDFTSDIYRFFQWTEYQI